MIIIEVKSYRLAKDVGKTLREFAEAFPQIDVVCQEEHLTYDVPGAMPGLFSVTFKVAVLPNRRYYG